MSNVFRSCPGRNPFIIILELADELEELVVTFLDATDELAQAVPIDALVQTRRECYSGALGGFAVFQGGC